jgi:hypothetical protein
MRKIKPIDIFDKRNKNKFNAYYRPFQYHVIGEEEQEEENNG